MKHLGLTLIIFIFLLSPAGVFAQEALQPGPGAVQEETEDVASRIEADARAALLDNTRLKDQQNLLSQKRSEAMRQVIRLRHKLKEQADAIARDEKAGQAIERKIEQAKQYLRHAREQSIVWARELDELAQALASAQQQNQKLNQEADRLRGSSQVFTSPKIAPGQTNSLAPIEALVKGMEGSIEEASAMTRAYQGISQRAQRFFQAAGLARASLENKKQPEAAPVEDSIALAETLSAQQDLVLNKEDPGKGAAGTKERSGLKDPLAAGLVRELSDFSRLLEQGPGQGDAVADKDRWLKAKETNDLLINSLHDLEQARGEAEQDIEKLAQELQGLARRIQERQDENEGKRKEIVRLEDSYREMIREVDRLLSEPRGRFSKERSRQEALLRQQVRTLKKENQALAQDLDEKKTREEKKARERKQDLENKISDEQARNKALRDQLAQLQAKIAGIQKEQKLLEDLGKPPQKSRAGATGKPRTSSPGPQGPGPAKTPWKVPEILRN